MNKQDIEERVKELESKERAREKKEIVTEWLRTKCLWVWTLLLGWCFYGGIFLVQHFDKVAAAVIAAFRAMNEK